MMRREAVDAIGLDELQRMNGMARGGVARLNYRQRVAANKNSPLIAQRRADRKAAADLANVRAFQRNRAANFTNEELAGDINDTNEQTAEKLNAARIRIAREQSKYAPTAGLNGVNPSLAAQAKKAGTNAIGQGIQGLFGLGNAVGNLNQQAKANSFGGLQLSGRQLLMMERLGLFNSPRGFANGGFVPGQGNTDSVPAMLMPGEFVMNKAAVQTIGVDKLAKANRVNRANGSTSVEGMSNGGVLNVNPELAQVFTKFDVSVAKLATAIEAMPHTITMSVRHTMEVVFNGAEVFASLQPAFQDLAVKTVETKINQMIRDKFPDVGSMQ
jgi:hypothetical protein